MITLAAIVAGVGGILSRSDHEGAICGAIRWVAGNSRRLPDIPLSALSRAARAWSATVEAEIDG